MSELSTPQKIQLFLDELTYSSDEFYRCPRRVLQDRLAHCFDGALFAAAALRLIGYPPIILDLVPNDRDDDHILALYKINGHWGAVAKSNFVGLRFREPVYRNLRELVMSYFEQYYNVANEKTLRAYTLPLNLKTFDKFDWMIHDDHLERIATRLDQLRKIPVITPEMEAGLSAVDKRSSESGLYGSIVAGLFKPEQAKNI
ncbi:hypothetical protein L0Z72_07080 [candidate division KSB1 bacterium]|nr:hypothetical protein [candidate division KSB1 bacterium]